MSVKHGPAPGLVLGLALGLAFAAVAAAGAVWYLVAGSKTSAGSIDFEDAQAVALGRSLYDRHCASCHGANLEGQPNWRQRRADGRLPAPPHDETGHTWHHPDAQLIALTKYGPAAFVQGTYESDMPGFEGTLSDQEIVAVLAFIKSTWPVEIRRRHDQVNARRP